MIIQAVITVENGEFGGQHTGLTATLRELADEPLMPYLEWVRVIAPEFIPVWRLDGQRMGGSPRGNWPNWASSTSVTKIEPVLDAASADYQRVFPSPGIPLGEPSDRLCGSDWISSTTLRFTGSVRAPSSYTVSVFANIVQHRFIVT